MSTDQARRYVQRACLAIGIDLFPPTRQVRGVLGIWWAPRDGREFGHVIIDAPDWPAAQQQLDAWRAERLA